MKHKVAVTAYSLEGAPDIEIFESRHRSPKAAARLLAELIYGRTQRARNVRRQIPAGYSGRYLVDDMPLETFRKKQGI